jgi:hypothetical protein
VLPDLLQTTEVFTRLGAKLREDIEREAAKTDFTGINGDTLQALANNRVENILLVLVFKIVH